MKTLTATKAELTPNWYVVDASNKVLGRLATEVASIIRGKHKPNYTPHLASGDCVIVINASKVRVTGNKAGQKEYTRYSGYHGGLKITTFREAMENDPEFVIKHAVKGMLPKNRLGRKLNKRLFVYAGDKHDQQAQKPQLLEL